MVVRRAMMIIYDNTTLGPLAYLSLHRYVLWRDVAVERPHVPGRQWEEISISRLRAVCVL